VAYEGRRDFYRNVYAASAWLMGLFPIIAFAVTFVTKQSDRVIFVAEVVGILAFAFFWLAKTAEVWRTAVETQAARKADTLD